MIGWSKDSLGLPSAPLHYGLKWPVGIPTVFQTPVTVPLHCNCLPLGLCKGTVKESTVVSHGRLLHNSLKRYHAEFFPEVSFPHKLNKQRVLMHGHQGWNVRHGLSHIYMIYVYIWVVYSFCLFCCLFIIVTTQFVALYKLVNLNPLPIIPVGHTGNYLDAIFVWGGNLCSICCCHPK